MKSISPNSRKTLVILLLAFALPVAVAKLILSLDLYQGGATNRGELISPTSSYTSLAMTNPRPQQWQLVYLLPANCDDTCRQRLYILGQSHIALGKDRHRVTPIIMLQPDSDIGVLEDYQFATFDSSPALGNMLAGQALIIIDPLGSLVLRYPIVSGRQAHIAQGKAMVNDLRKLLKLSRIG